MFDRTDKEIKLSQIMQERTASQFGQGTEDSGVYEVQAERQYVSHLKVQRQKIEALYSKYDTLLGDLKSKDTQIKQKDKTITTLESKCKTLSFACHETSSFKNQNNEIKTENVHLQKAISELEDSYTFLHGQFRSKEAVSCQKYDQMESLNDQLMSKLRSLTNRFQEREEEFEHKYKTIGHSYSEFKLEAKKSKEIWLEEQEILKSALLQKDEEMRLLSTQNQCLKSRISELENGIGEMVLEHEDKLDQVQKQKKCQVRILKNEIDQLKEFNHSLERKWQKIRDQCELKDCSLLELNQMIAEHDKQNYEAIHLMKQQFTQEKSALKQQLIKNENHIEKLERKIADLVRKEQCLYGKIKKYEVCMESKRNLRQIEQQQLQKINYLLNLP